MATFKVKQDDLRKLMKERREKSKAHSGRIDSPFAKYNSIGQLSCSICSIIIKNNGLWGAHVAGKIHKENLFKHKKGSSGKESRIDLNLGIKRKLETTEDLKRLKSEVTQPSEEKQPPKSSALLAGYSSSEESDNTSDQESKTTAPSEAVTSTVLPPGFFDASEASSTTPSSSSVKPELENSSSLTNNAEALPEGFFDDPVLDAKARNIEYKDPVEEEWERFQKTIAEETSVSKTIIEEDLEESTLERDIDQIDEQIQQWERVNNLQSLADDVVKKAPKKDNGNDASGGTDDELEEDDLLDWRSKGVKKL